MRTFAAALCLALLLAGCAGGPGGSARDRFYRSLKPQANPSAVIATELAFAREAREKGQWTAFRKFAADNAVMFVPEAVEARKWLSRRDDPAQPVQWQPHQLWSSCDGSLSVTRGAWQRPDGTTGYYTTVWERRGRPGDEEEHRWLLDQGDDLAEPLTEPDIIRTQVADCAPDGLPAAFASAQTERDAGAETAGLGLADGYGESRDRTLVYRYRVAPDRSRVVSVFLRKGDTMEEVLRSEVAAPAGD